MTTPPAATPLGVKESDDFANRKARPTCIGWQTDNFIFINPAIAALSTEKQRVAAPFGVWGKVSDIPVELYIDTGAQNCFVSKEFADRINEEILPTSQIFVLAQSTRIKPQGKISATVEIDNVKVPTTFYVLKGLCADCIIGIDFLYEAVIAIDLVSQKLIMRTPADVGRVRRHSTSALSIEDGIVENTFSHPSEPRALSYIERTARFLATPKRALEKLLQNLRRARAPTEIDSLAGELAEGRCLLADDASAPSLNTASPYVANTLQKHRTDDSSSCRTADGIVSFLGEDAESDSASESSSGSDNCETLCTVDSPLLTRLFLPLDERLQTVPPAAHSLSLKGNILVPAGNANEREFATHSDSEREKSEHAPAAHLPAGEISDSAAPTARERASRLHVSMTSHTDAHTARNEREALPVADYTHTLLQYQIEGGQEHAAAAANRPATDPSICSAEPHPLAMLTSAAKKRGEIVRPGGGRKNQSSSRDFFFLPNGAPIIRLPDYCPGASECTCIVASKCKSIVPHWRVARGSCESRFDAEFERFGIPKWVVGTDLFNNNAPEFDRYIHDNHKPSPELPMPAAQYWVSKSVAELIGDATSSEEGALPSGGGDAPLGSITTLLDNQITNSETTVSDTENHENPIGKDRRVARKSKLCLIVADTVIIPAGSMCWVRAPASYRRRDLIRASGSELEQYVPKPIDVRATDDYCATARKRLATKLGVQIDDAVFTGGQLADAALLVGNFQHEQVELFRGTCIALLENLSEGSPMTELDKEFPLLASLALLLPGQESDKTKKDTVSTVDEVSNTPDQKQHVQSTTISEESEDVPPEEKPSIWRKMRPDRPMGHFSENAKIVAENVRESFPNIGATEQLLMDVTQPLPGPYDVVPPVRDYDLDAWEGTIDFSQSVLTPTEKEKLIALIREFGDIFATKPEHVVGSDICRVRPLFNNYEPMPPIRPIPYAPDVEQIILDTFDKYEKAKFVKPVVSQFVSPVVAVRKKTVGAYRPTVDLRRQNLRAIPYSYPMPTTDLIRRQLSKWDYCSSLDAYNGFYNLVLTEDTQKLFAVILPNRRIVAFCRLPQGAQQSPMIFQNVIDFVLSRLQSTFGYIDDFITTSVGAFDVHLLQLRALFNRLRWAKIVLSPAKCEFGVKQTVFLGMSMTPDGIRPGDRGIRAVSDMKLPQTLKELRTFLGMASHFCHTACPAFTTISDCLYTLANETAAAARKANAPRKNNTSAVKICSKRLALKWTDEHTKAVENIKVSLTTAPVLSYARYDRPFCVEVDASGTQCGGILSQPSATSPGVIAYYSRRFRKAELSYATFRKEALAVFFALRRWAPYISTRPVVVISDCRSVVQLFRKADASAPLARLWLALTSYNLYLVHKPGEKMAADCLSRITTADVDELPVRRLAKHDDLNDILSNWDVTAHDGAINASNDDFNRNAFMALFPDTPSRHRILPTTATRGDSLAVTAVAPVSAESDDTESIADRLSKEQQGDVFLLKLGDALHGQNTLPVPQSEYERTLIRQAKRLSIVNGVIRRQWRRPPGFHTYHQFVAPPSARERLLGLAHSVPAGGHHGVNRTLERLRTACFWPFMEDDCRHYIAACGECTELQTHKPVPHAPVGRHFHGAYPMSVLIIDVLGAIGGHDLYKFVLVCQDDFTKFAFVEPLRSQKTTVIIQALSDIFHRFGYASVVACDAGSSFTGAEFRQFLEGVGVKLRIAPAARHESVGSVERLNSILLHALRASCDTPSDWPNHLQATAFAFNSVSGSTGVAPMTAMLSYVAAAPLSLRCAAYEPEVLQQGPTLAVFVHNARARLARICRSVANTLDVKRDRQADNNARSGFYFLYSVNDPVAVHMQPKKGDIAKLSRHFQIGWRIVAVHGYHCYSVRRDNGKGRIIKLHADRLRPAIPLQLPERGECTPRSQRLHSTQPDHSMTIELDAAEQSDSEEGEWDEPSTSYAAADRGRPKRQQIQTVVENAVDREHSRHAADIERSPLSDDNNSTLRPEVARPDSERRRKGCSPPTNNEQAELDSERLYAQQRSWPRHDHNDNELLEIHGHTPEERGLSKPLDEHRVIVEADTHCEPPEADDNQRSVSENSDDIACQESYGKPPYRGDETSVRQHSAGSTQSQRTDIARGPTNNSDSSTRTPSKLNERPKRTRLQPSRYGFDGK